MTHPDREELAGRKNLMLALHQWVRDDTNTALKMVVTPAMLEKLAERIEAAAAPSVEEVARVIDPRSFEDLAYAKERLPAEPRSKYFTDLARLSQDGVDAALAKAQAIIQLFGRGE